MRQIRIAQAALATGAVLAATACAVPVETEAAPAPATVAPAQPAGTDTELTQALSDAGMGPQVAQASAGRPARARLSTADGRRAGTVWFWDTGRDGSTAVLVSLRLPDGVTAPSSFHGFHVHANNDPANGTGCVADPAQPPATWFVSADGHLAGPEGGVHRDHAGDMASLLVKKNSTAEMVFLTDRFRVEDVRGKAVIVHAKPDNFANVPLGVTPDSYTANSAAATDLTNRTGNAGNRLLCGVVS